MAFTSDDLGARDDSVRLVLDGEELVIAESWDVAEGILSQPSAFSLRLGSSGTAADIITRFPKNTPFELYIRGALQMSGNTDGIEAAGRATQVTIKGRDALAPIHDSGIEKVRSFVDDTYTSVVKWAMSECGINPNLLDATNAANRQIKAGIPVEELEPPTQSDEIVSAEVQGTSGETVGKIISQQHQNEIAETAHEFIRRHIDRAGLMFWATADGRFVLSVPNGKQKPIYRLVRRQNGHTEWTNVVDSHLMDDATHRHAVAVVYGRGGGKKHGRLKVKGAYVDEEMVNLGFDKIRVFRDVNVQNVAQAEFYARRKLAEERRAGFELSYTVSGHTLPAIGSSARAVITPDTCIEIVDERYGIEDVFWIESVRRSRQPETITSFRCMRLGDLIFGGDA